MTYFGVDYKMTNRIQPKKNSINQKSIKISKYQFAIIFQQIHYE
jgi:hypothetical protein